jgi:hypothetical protein
MSAKFNSEIAAIGNRQKLVSHRGSGSAWRDRVASEVVPRPNRNTARQPAAVPDRHGGLRRARLSMRGGETLLPFFRRHRLVGDDIMDVGVLRPLDEHPQMLAQRHQCRQLVMHLDAERSCRTLRYRRDRSGRVLIELVDGDQ